ncbi:MAG: TauD/TfdA family dioxygenase [Burkholderiales bacterium]
MGDFRTFTKRGPAAPMMPIRDATAWTPDALRDVNRWSYRLSEGDRAQLIDATVRLQGVPVERVDRDNFALGSFAAVMEDVRRELLDGRGIVMVQGFPVDALDREGQTIAYFGMGAHLGRRLSQNRDGHLLGHVKDLGGDYADANTRGYMTRAEMRFHSDSCDYVGLLCLQTAMRGGESLVASSVTVYNRMLDLRPDLVEALSGDLYRSRMGEIGPGEEPWYKLPIFCFDADGRFYSVGGGVRMDHAQTLPGVPRYTALQSEALDLYRKTIRECAAEIPFLPGDVQFLNNYVTMHTRRAYEDWPDPSRKRHLLRLWLADPDSHPKGLREDSFRRGILPKTGTALHAPLDARDATRLAD